MEDTKQKEIMKGGEFLVKETQLDEVFIPEELSEEQTMFRNMVRDFVYKEVHPKVDELDEQQEGLMVSLLKKAAELGLLGANVPEEFQGMAVDFLTETVITEEVGPSYSFGVAFAAHTGIGTLPILYFGTQEQKAKYLPKLATGEWAAAYCLTEPSSGSDALSAKTTAMLSDDGKHYVLNGQKMWITNGGFADLFTVFAQVDGDKFTGFLVEAGMEGVTRGAEEKKMGIKGSSTTQIFLENVKVPVENVLGEIGKGHRIAFNVLNIGRYKLGVMSCGGTKLLTGIASKYANERHQFGKPISSFGAIQHKLAEMAIRSYALESSSYRIGKLVYDKIDQLKADGLDPVQAKLKAAEEYAVECAFLKVFGSEVLDYCADESVQIYGGMGFSEESPVARVYRDARINRIFEGTNEINRLLSVDMILKRAMKGQIDLFGPAMEVQKELMSVPSFGSNGDTGILAKEIKAVRNSKKAVLMVAGAAAQKFMADLENQQEIIMAIADMAFDLYAMESTLLRTRKLIGMKGEENCGTQIDATKVFVCDSLDRMHKSGREAIAAFAEGDEGKMMMMGVKRFTKIEANNNIAARRRIAAKLIEHESYSF